MNEIVCYCVNLNRRPDRWEKIKTTVIPNVPFTINRWPAIDGQKYTLNAQEYNLFKTGDYNFRSGMVGCALSHLYLWKNSIHETLLVLEDDVQIADVSTFEQNLKRAYQAFKDEKLDVLYLHTLLRQPTNDNTFKIDKPSGNIFSYTYGSTAAYLISKSGIEKILNHIRKVGMTNAIDTVMLKTPHLNSGFCSPLLFSAPLTNYNTRGDTDIQHDYSTLQRTFEDAYQDECAFLKREGVEWTLEKVSSDKVFCYELWGLWIHIPHPTTSILQQRLNRI